MTTTAKEYNIRLGGSVVDLSNPVVMAIVNITPDSFWKGSRLAAADDRTLSRVIGEAVAAGAAILDIGGYSSRPGAEDVPPYEELDRVCRAMEIIRRDHPSVAVSIDTFRASVAGEVIKRYGPCIVNDISAGELDPEMVPLVASLDVPYIAMHMRGTPSDMQQHTGYRDVVEDVAGYLDRRALFLQESGIGQVILDPGFGFAKTVRENYILMNGLDRICELGYPMLSGISRKSMIYKVINSSPEESLPGTDALNWESLRKGASILRVHDVGPAVDITKLFNFYKNSICLPGK